jgi:hypothetical protein
MSKKLKIQEVTKLAQIFCHYPQDMYLELDLEDGSLSASYRGDVGGNSMPAYVWHSRAIRFYTPLVCVETMNSLMHNIADEAQEILDGAEIVWNGNNNVGSFTEEASEIIEKLHFDLSQIDSDLEIEEEIEE